MALDHNLLKIYLADHRAVCTAVSWRLQQMQRHTELPFSHEIDQMYRDVTAETIWLDAFSARHHVPCDRVKSSGARLAEMLRRLKLNETIRFTSPLSPIREVERLTATVTMKIRLWETLATLPAATRDAADLGELLDQAHQHYEDTTRWHRILRQQAFSLAP